MSTNSTNNPKKLFKIRNAKDKQLGLQLIVKKVERLLKSNTNQLNFFE